MLQIIECIFTLIEGQCKKVLQQCKSVTAKKKLNKDNNAKITRAARQTAFSIRMDFCNN